ncbi:hypothetical protein LX36DRAFT_279360 [Colletotrichum falcatum]|nr:hypothetical protein LX36DRAFT_279360 [Colletotrichum falcatum]
MRLSRALAGLVATASAASAFPASFLPVGNLPSQSTTAELINKNIGDIQGAVANVTAAVQAAVDAKDGDGDGDAPAAYAVLGRAITLQALVQTARLNSNGIREPFSPEDSAAVVDNLGDLLSAVQAASTQLLAAKSAGVLGALADFGGPNGKFLQPLGITGYLELLTTDAAAFLKAVLSYLDGSVKDSAGTVASSINGALQGIEAAYTPSKQRTMA